MKARRSAEQLHEEVMDDLLPKAVTFLAESERQADNRQRKERELAERYEEFAECAYAEEDAWRGSQWLQVGLLKI